MEIKKIKFPNSCIANSSKWSFAEGLSERLIGYHNTSCINKTSKEAKQWRKTIYFPLVHATHKEILDTEKSFIEENYWNSRIPDHVSGGAINYPVELNQTNEGSKGNFLICLLRQLSNVGKSEQDEDYQVVLQALHQARQDARACNYWKATLEDIIDVV